jgi:hypothetical protein
MFRKTIKPVLVVFASLALLSLAGCDLFSGITVTAIVTNVTIAGVPIAQGEIDLMDGTAPITDATVTVTFNSILHNCPGVNGIYSLPPLTPPITTAGDSVTLAISVPSKNLNLTKSLTLPDLPAISAPNPINNPFNPKAPITVTWSLVSPTPSQYEILVPLDFTTSGNNYLKSLSNTATTWDIPGTPTAQTIKSTQTDVPINVVAVNSTTLYASGNGVSVLSSFSVGNTRTVLINTN